jgi:hypothetical protein
LSLELFKSLKEYQEYDPTSQGPSIIMEEDNEDCSPNLKDEAPKQLIADRWELWKRKQALFKRALTQAF